MKTLYLMRHAKAEPDGPAGDKSRPLSERGVRDAKDQGVALREAGIDLALVSTAVRTVQTFECLGLDCRAEFMDALYHADAELVLQRISEIDEDVKSLLVVGHSPTIPEVASQLLSSTMPREADQLRCHFPTATVTALRVEGPWSEIGKHPAELA